MISACEYCGRLRLRRSLKKVPQADGITWKWGCRNARRCVGRMT